jgi:hypothetical protein
MTTVIMHIDIQGFQEVLDNFCLIKQETNNVKIY